MAIVTELMMKTTIAIGVKNQKDIFIPIATGFFVSKKLEKSKKENVSFLVTNYHVVENKSSIWIRFFNKITQKLEIMEIQLFDNHKKTLYIKHPTKDVVIIPMLVKRREIMSSMNLDIDSFSITIEQFYQAGGNIGSHIFMLGFPLQLINIDNEYPLFRNGYVAKIDKFEKTLYLDLQNFPGSSGSPILTYPEFISIDRTKSIQNVKLMGVVSHYVPYYEDLVKDEHGNVILQRRENSGIAKAVPIECVMEMINKFIEKILNDQNKK